MNVNYTCPPPILILLKSHSQMSVFEIEHPLNFTYYYNFVHQKYVIVITLYNSMATISVHKD